ncbi:MAG: GNAT family N-acetyltransferase [Desulfobacterales bacterium]|nr:GNAT family N-acetyltransferase [Desulfobacterales bacterium]
MKPILISKNQLNLSGKVFSEAFSDDPFISYVFPDLKERQQKSSKYWYLSLKYAYLYGEVYTISNDLEGVVAWLPSEKLDTSLIRIIRSGNFQLPWLIGFSPFKRLVKCVDWVMSVQKQKAPLKHMYLNALCVSPNHQGNGFSNMLLKSMFKRLDEENLPCYMETQKPHIVPFYERFGFKVVDEQQIPGTDLINWAMIRNPNFQAT